MVTLDQSRESLDAASTLSDALTGGSGDHVSAGGQVRHVISYMKDFLFSPEQARTPVGELSGGERGRLMLARALARPSNLLVLDEPTNDLDLETLDLLQEMLADYQGAVMLVSHDRDFIDRIVTSVIAFEGQGHWCEYAGGYSDIAAQQSGAGSEVKSKSKAVGKSPAAKAPGKAKLSFKETHALKTIPDEMARLQGEIEGHQNTLADTDLYARDRQTFDAAATALAAAAGDLAGFEEEWLALEIKREEIEGG
jgi:ATP-binding cassette subfamily F protein uup